ncbi:Epsin-3, clathrin recruitment and traffic between the Golgi and endosome [Emmonsiellopsis sp. PD_33]|nr:Epsin-3, clathrin recruitment and traffic between the Golgi and endosome [Emmonsiellopsis sp. PD_33]
MDFNSLKDQVSNLTLYDLKAGVRKVQNAVMNYTEMEAKVREATNNEPWGASSTLMQEIANATHSYQLLNEIMPMIYKRFTEKTAEEWRQIYKALQLLEFLVKNGSERVIDDARSHVSLLRMLRQFHYIDQNGKDQGVNVRNRSQELAKLLSDVDMIRSERKKARANRNKFGGIEGGMSLSSFGGGSRYGGFGSDEAGYGGYSGGVYGDGGGFGGSTGDYGGSTGGFQDSGRRSNRFEEYDEGDAVPSPSTSTLRRPESTPAAPVKRETKPPAPKESGADLLDFGDVEPAPAAPRNQGTSGITTQGLGEDDDDFDDFQSAPSSAQAAPSQPQFSAILAPPTMAPTTGSTTQFAAPKPVSGTQGADLNGLVDFTSPPMSSNVSPASTQPPSITGRSASIQSQPPKPTGYQAAQPNYFTSVPAPQPSQALAKSPLSPAMSGNKPASSTGAKASGGDVFGSLWSSASSNAGIKSTAAQQPKGPNLASMAQEKASAGIWGTPAASSPSLSSGSKPASQSQQNNSGLLDDF